MTQAATLVADALGLLGVLDPIEDIDAEDAALGLRTLNRIVDTAAADSLLCVAVAFLAIPLTSGDGDMTIGLAGNVVAPKPTSIEPGAYLLSGQTSYPLDAVTRDQWAEIVYKTQAGIPRCFLYEPTTAVLGTVNFWPVPDQPYTAYLPVKSRLSAFADLVTQYSLPEGWDEFLTTSLAISLAPNYGREAPGSIVSRMRTAKKLVKRLNIRIPSLSLPELQALTGGNRSIDIRNDY